MIQIVEVKIESYPVSHMHVTIVEIVCFSNNHFTGTYNHNKNIIKHKKFNLILINVHRLTQNE